MQPRDVRTIEHKIPDNLLDKIGEGVSAIASVVKATMGPGGANVLVENQYGSPTVTKDGVTAAKSVFLYDSTANMAAQLVKEAAVRTSETSGDGPQPLHSLVLTPNGFVRMGDVKEGMEVCGTNGSIQKVVGVFEKGDREIYKVRFTDGREVECSEDHLWTVTTPRGTRKTLTVRQMIDSGNICKENGDSVRRGFFVQRNAVELFDDSANQPIDPYLLGVLLGDGSLSGTGNIELSLGFKKRHILKKLKLPKGTVANPSECEKYIRVKLNGGSLKSDLQELGLYGTKSDTKFIPKSYLFSSTKNRKKLLQGLMDTDGYLNPKGLFEFSTVSPQLAADVSDLMRSLGKDICSVFHTRENDPDSYSRKPIFRITELKGNTYGMAIDSIKPTGVKVPMRCIKVSNTDHLYVTDGFVVTHNTTTTTAIAEALYFRCVDALKAGVLPLELRKQVASGVRKAVDALKSRALVTRDPAALRDVARISANDEKVGDLVSDILGGDPSRVVVLEENGGIETTFDLVDGTRLEKGFRQGNFVTNRSDMTFEAENVSVLVVKGKLTEQSEVERVLETAFFNETPKGLEPNGRPAHLVIVGEDVSGDAMAFLALNHQMGNFKVCPVPPPDFGSLRDDCLEDIAAVTGGKVFDASVSGGYATLTLAHFGRCKKAIVSRSETLLVGPQADPDAVRMRLDDVKVRMEATRSTVEKERLAKRQSRLAGKVAVVHVGGATLSEIMEVRQRVEDACQAVSAAAEDGLLPGSGNALAVVGRDLIVSEKDPSPGEIAVYEAMGAPMRTVQENAGIAPENDPIVIDKLTWDKGTDARTGEKVDSLMKAGIVDPLKVAVHALHNAASVVGMLASAGVSVTFTEHAKSSRDVG